MAFFQAFALERFFAKHEFSARYLLCSSDCESFPIRELLAMEPDALERLLDLRLGYTETRGAPSLRLALAGLYAGLSPDGIFVHAGAEEAILNLYLALVSAGDRVVVNAPAYQSLSEIPRALGAQVVPWNLRPSTGRDGRQRWALDPDELPALSGGQAKIIVVNMPHNPTGALMNRDEFESLVSYARKTGAILVVDEVY
ncbi:MAG TPA: aminotransferase class I/II-fold pyridoxal phosphate-dependent enzyme, partial [Spirochaetales bacterium]|nr:aminotransferase class I/II-fold pyridoxal phosphate-dependent enzyme [Spirochaetales bacterium]